METQTANKPLTDAATLENGLRTPTRRSAPLPPTDGFCASMLDAGLDARSCPRKVDSESQRGSDGSYRIAQRLPARHSSDRLATVQVWAVATRRTHPP